MKEKLKELFTWPDQIPSVTPDKHHWFGQGNEIVLNKLIDEIQPKFILEMGSWTGAGSTSFILNKAPDAHLVCVDHWSNELEVHNTQKALSVDILMQDAERIKVLFDLFLNNTWEHRHHLTPIRKNTIDGLNLLKTLDIPFDLIYIDAHHDYESVLHDISISIENWPNAVICGDDYRWPDRGVEFAVQECAKKYNLEVFGVDQCWYYVKK